MSFAEAVQHLGKPQNYVKSAVYAGEIKAALYCSLRDFLVFSRSPGGDVIGHAVCRYFGPITVDPSHLHRLLEGKKAVLGLEGARPLEPGNISDWRAACPFSVPNAGALTQWHSLDSEVAIQGELFFTPLPNQYMGKAGLREMVENRPAGVHNEKFLQAFDDLANHLLKYDYGLDFSARGKFAPSDMLLAVSPGVPGIVSAEPVTSPMAVPLECPLSRADAMSRLVWRVMSGDSSISAKRVFAILEREALGESADYDIEGILSDVHGDSIMWRASPDASPRKIGLASLRNRMSRIRGALKS